METLLLWDIDGTLLRGNGIGTIAFNRATKELFQCEIDWSGISFAGSTDGIIVQQILERCGVADTPEHQYRLEMYYTHYFASLVTDHNFTVFSGVHEVLNRAGHDSRYFQALLTGNFEAAAWMKVCRNGMGGFFSCGAFGGETRDRSDIARRAVERVAQRTGVRFPAEKTIVIGDTIHDVRCGKAINAHTLCVTTGQFSREELEASGADMVIEDLSDADRFFEAVESLVGV
ncbi:MAG: HAD hydrolase-like protein [Opitutales bacterium]|nr:HAD hydrolase-like protein [Opitutales bacterium]